jgi:phenylpropionate dioxygenase-like ring-hydroxylating dioxygenase large terminal subunit
LPGLDPIEHGLVGLETELWMGYVFVRFLASRQPSVAEMMAPYLAQIAPYRVEQVKPRGYPAVDEMAANWKAVRDVDNEGYHVPIAHPSLQDLYGDNYCDDFPPVYGMVAALAPFKTGAARLWSVGAYRKILPEAEHLPETHRRAWFGVGLFPNLVLQFYPDQIGFYQEFPISVGRTLQRGASYGLPDDRREMRLARYLADRIDRVTSREDIELIQWSWEAMQSSGFRRVILSDLEHGVRQYHDQLRALIPVMTLDAPPAPGTLKQTNDALIARGPTDPWAAGAVPQG